MKIIIIVGIIVVIIAVLFIIFLKYYNYFKWVKIKLEKGEKEVRISLEKEYDIQAKYLKLLKLDDTLNKKENNELSIEELNQNVIEVNQQIEKHLDNNEKLLKDKNIQIINKNLHNSNISSKGARKYYNENIMKYNKLCNNYPSKIISKICQYKEKELLNEEEYNEFKILSK